ncbi:MAG: site-specific integrase [Gemmatimonadales bacterium]
MSTELFFPDPTIRQRLRVGPLAADINGFAAQLASQGYAHATAKDKLRLVSHVSRSLADQALSIDVLDEQWVETFLLGHEGQRAGKAATCRQLLSYLRACGHIPAGPPDRSIEGPREQIERAYERYLVFERGVTSATVSNYLPTVHTFLTERFGTVEVQLETLVAQDANRFVLRHAQRFSRTRVKLIVTVLRSFLRFLHQRGDIPVDLAGAVLPVMYWRLSGLPKSLAPEQVESMLGSCDQSTIAGRRDYAILLLLARLGLRAGEVVAMTLDDLDWDTGVVTVPGKGQRREPLPLPHEVGEALAGYLRNGRPACTTRCLFVRLQAPHRGFASSVAICNVVRRALARARIDPPFKGSHLLRHSLATEMLRRGASLEDIGQILRHRHPETTQIYAKVDLEALRALAQPWPGGAP